MSLLPMLSMNQYSLIYIISLTKHLPIRDFALALTDKDRFFNSPFFIHDRNNVLSDPNGKL